VLVTSSVLTFLLFRDTPPAASGSSILDSCFIVLFFPLPILYMLAVIVVLISIVCSTLDECDSCCQKSCVNKRICVSVFSRVRIVSEIRVSYLPSTRAEESSPARRMFKLSLASRLMTHSLPDTSKIERMTARGTSKSSGYPIFRLQSNAALLDSRRHQSLKTKEQVHSRGVNIMQRTSTMVMMSQRTKTNRQQSFRGGEMLLSCIACLILVSSISTASAFTSPTITRSTNSKIEHNHNTIRANAVNDNKFHRVSRCYGRRNQYYDDDEDDDYYDDDEDDDDRRRRSRNNKDDLGQGKQSSGLNLPSSFGRRDGWRLPDSVTKSLLAGVFILGVGLGVTVDSQVNTNPKDLASRDAIDQAAPNKNLCAQYGASAMAFDQRVFVSFNPFNVYVSQADVKPACVLREANVVPTLKSRGLINDDEVRSW
jgi:hypothetical protein